MGCASLIMMVAYTLRIIIMVGYLVGVLLRFKLIVNCDILCVALV